jgi:Mg2+/Co2+ transporter CorC
VIRADYNEDTMILRAQIEDAESEYDYVVERVRDIARGIITAKDLLDELEERCP